MMRTWFITGASRGLGFRIAEAALGAGDRVVATARKADDVVAALGQSERLLALPLDVTDETQAQQAADAAIARFGRIDILVNNAGYGLLGSVEEASAEEIEAIYRVNVFGLMAVTRAVLPNMRQNRSGHILNLSSVGGFVSGAGFGVYCSTKFAVEGLSEALAAELAPLGIKLTIIEPGYFRTDFLEARSLVVSPTRIADYDATSGMVREAAKTISLNQPGDPAKLGTAVIALVDAANPPLRLALGSDTFAVVGDKLTYVRGELDAWEQLSKSTDFGN
jgi:NAD(P)-dependent dehydrogenase (short-subunit alcohol dehydrogenase family)